MECWCPELVKPEEPEVPVEVAVDNRSYWVEPADLGTGTKEVDLDSLDREVRVVQEVLEVQEDPAVPVAL